MGVLKFDARRTYFDGIGTEITGAQKTDTAIKLAGLDYTVEKKQLYLADGTEAENCFVNVRTDTNQIIGRVSDRYEIMQNAEAFDFMDSLVENGADFVNAGSTNDGKRAFIVAKTEPMKILDDEFDPYILFMNSFDGGFGVQAMFTPVRVWCSNCFVAASEKASNKITIRHSKNMRDKLYIARDTLLKNTEYLNYIKERSEYLATQTFTRSQYESLVDTLVPIKVEASDKIIERKEQLKDDMMTAYDQEDLQNYNNTIYKALQAIADIDSHTISDRKNANDFAMMNRIIGGMLLLNIAAKEITKRTGILTY